MKIIELEEMKKIELSILKHVHNFCELHDLKYFLAGGTLLGAVRHEGFIPWDDDIDIIMPRSDYMKFLQLSKGGIGDQLEVLSMYNSKEYMYSFAKVIDNRTELIENDISNKSIGVYIDVFPMDGLPSTIKDSDKFFKKMKIYQNIRLLIIHNYKKDSKKMPLKILSKFFLITMGYEWILKKIDRFSSKYIYEDSDFVAVSVAGYGRKERIEKKYCTELKKMRFEDDFFYVPVYYEKYLKNLYGDYMKLPPENNRVSHHRYKAFWK
ncbi:LicD family protein [Paenibacillus tepidiphilus]|uniref:LicD family protein n=1 Tax=Paenibacillus tepidiphilus TaxID=2608683 RepID=UPI00123A0460|nr:LicD family protein [Paenibacillus tepidiphilus]